MQFNTQDSVFVDLFGGTGQIGIEAFSRGAQQIIIVENKKENLNIINKNISKLKNADNIKLVNSNAIDFLNKAPAGIDIIFIDPPYSQSDLINKALEAASKLINFGGIIITETLSSQLAESKIQNLTLQKRYNYGKISLNLYKME